jgi:glutathione S-transferase
MSKLTLHIANKNYSSWSLRPWILMKTLGIGFEERAHIFGGGYGKNQHFQAFSPSAMVPCLVDDLGAVWDSLAIAETLAETHPNVWPQDKLARRYARSACAEMHSGFSALRNQCTMTVGQRIRLHDINDDLRANIERLEALWTYGFDNFGGPWLAGEKFTAVDAFFAPVAFRWQTYGFSIGERSEAYLQRLLMLEGMTEWQELALKEDFRDWDHELDAKNVGIITHDYRVPLHDRT